MRSEGPGTKAERPPSPGNFYGRKAISAADALELDEARAVEGLQDEIDLLRVRLRAAIVEQPADFKLMTHGVALLVKAVAAQYRLSPKARKELADNIAAVLNGFGNQILPADR